MSDWAAKRFWKEASISDTGSGFAVLLDSRPVRTPAKAPLVVPTAGLATEIAREWDAQSGKINPESMPFTRAANAAIDKVAAQFHGVAQMLADYGDADLICYRAPSPASLAARQAVAWDPLLAWAKTRLGAELTPHIGVIHHPQSPQALARLHHLVAALDPFTMAAFHDLVSLSGSLVIGFAALHDYRPAPELWDLSRIDEIWQQEQWGEDEEALENANIKRESFLRAKQFSDLVNMTNTTATRS